MTLLEYRDGIMKQIKALNNKLATYNTLLRTDLDNHRCSECTKVIDDPFFIDDSDNTLHLVECCIDCVLIDNDFEFKEIIPQPEPTLEEDLKRLNNKCMEDIKADDERVIKENKDRALNKEKTGYLLDDEYDFSIKEVTDEDLEQAKKSIPQPEYNIDLDELGLNKESK